MGSKITIDSATLVNKCLELIEAKYLFDLNEQFFELVVHPQSIIPVSYTHLRAHETKANLVCRLLLEKKKTKKTHNDNKTNTHKTTNYTSQLH